MPELVLASGSEIRAQLLQQVNVPFRVRKAPVDEDALKAGLLAEGISPRDLSDALAEAKAQRIGMKEPDALVLGCDQILELDGAVLSKPKDRDEAADQLRRLSGKRHILYSAAVIFHEARPIWRLIGESRLTMRDLSDDGINGYLDRNWPKVSYCVGAYQVESEGLRLFSRIEGDYFSILGLPMTGLLTFLIDRKVITP